MAMDEDKVREIVAEMINETLSEKGYQDASDVESIVDGKLEGYAMESYVDNSIDNLSIPDASDFPDEDRIKELALESVYESVRDSAPKKHSQDVMGCGWDVVCELGYRIQESQGDANTLIQRIADALLSAPSDFKVDIPSIEP